MPAPVPPVMTGKAITDLRICSQVLCQRDHAGDGRGFCATTDIMASVSFRPYLCERHDYAPVLFADIMLLVSMAPYPSAAAPAKNRFR